MTLVLIKRGNLDEGRPCDQTQGADGCEAGMMHLQAKGGQESPLANTRSWKRKERNPPPRAVRGSMVLLRP